MNRVRFLQWMKQIATLGPVGYFVAPGTVATVVTLPVVIILKQCVPAHLTLFVVALVTLLAYFIIEYALQLLPYSQDPSQIVLDEVVGCLWSFAFVPVLSASLIFAGFVLFRFFDIFKPMGVAYAERLPRAVGILADDLLAAVYTATILYFVCI